MDYGVVCQLCGIEAPSKRVQFRQNIGAVVVNYHSYVKGKLCKRCIHKKYWSMTAVTLLLGWWGLLSMIVAPVFILINTLQYLVALVMPGVPKGAARPPIDDDILYRVWPSMPQILERMTAKEDLSDIARQLSVELGLTPGQVHDAAIQWFRDQELLQRAAQRNAQIPQALGFPVIIAEDSADVTPGH